MEVVVVVEDVVVVDVVVVDVVVVDVVVVVVAYPRQSVMDAITGPVNATVSSDGQT